MSHFEDNTNDGGHQYLGSSGGNDIAGGDARNNVNAEEAGLRTRTSCPFPFGYFNRLRLETNDATSVSSYRHYCYLTFKLYIVYIYKYIYISI